MRAAFHAHFVRDFGDQVAEPDIAGVRVRHVLDEMRQFVAGVDAFELRRAIDVIFAVHQPVHVEYHDRIHAEFAAAAANFMMAVDRRLTAAFMRAVQLGQI
jgi:hypothetical protein